MLILTPMCHNIAKKITQLGRFLLYITNMPRRNLKNNPVCLPAGIKARQQKAVAFARKRKQKVTAFIIFQVFIFLLNTATAMSVSTAA